MNKDLLLANANQDQAWCAIQHWHDECPPDVRGTLFAFLQNSPERTTKTVLKEMRKLDSGSLEIIRRLAIHMFHELGLRKANKEVEA